jgi:UDP-glucose 4-epimerase
MTYLITGACGNLGRYVTSAFLSSGHDVIGIDIKTSVSKKSSAYLQKLAATNNKNFTVHWIDLTQADSLEKAFIENKNKIKGIVHLAFIIPPFSEKNPEKIHHIHISSMKNLISLTEKYTPSATFVFTSTVTVFCPPNKMSDIIDVNHPIEGSSQYTQDKIDCENLLQKSQLDWKILRLSVIMNPIFRAKAEAAKYGLLIDLNCLVEPVHSADVATAVLHASTFPNTSRKIFIISGGEKNRMTYREYIYGILKATMPNVKPEDVPWHNFTGQKKNYLHWYDTKESQALLQFQQRSFEDYSIDANKQLNWFEKLAASLLSKQIISRFFGK